MFYVQWAARLESDLRHCMRVLYKRYIATTLWYNRLSLASLFHKPFMYPISFLENYPLPVPYFDLA